MSAPTARKRAPAKRASKRAAAAPVSQRDRLLGRPRPTLPHRLLVDAEQAASARAALVEAQKDARRVELRDGSTERQRQAAQQKVADAEAAVDGCYETLLLRALPPRRVEELEAAHPPTDAQMAAAGAEREKATARGDEPPDWPSFNDDTFWPALLAESVDGDMTVDDWEAFLTENVSDGELRSLRVAALNVNHAERVADPMVLPKGLTQMLSSRLS